MYYVSSSKIEFEFYDFGLDDLGEFTHLVRPHLFTYVNHNWAISKPKTDLRLFMKAWGQTCNE